ncbi:hypothetical protein NQ318_022420 [Aromia moschata]|uniref:Uncharacterized protein n=1 Tax=Aromia moschata TaxID=1265417 RepID=A0AAV8Z4S1_9CUCU|nr:hypothetical protein NQ318_022420 [Aromia moschata]
MIEPTTFIVGIIGENTSGPFFIDGNLNGETYLALLRNNVVPTMANLYPAEGNTQLPGLIKSGVVNRRVRIKVK